MSAQRPDSLSLAVAKPDLWTSSGDGEVKLRMGESGFASEPPLTVDQMFKTAVERFGSYTALGWKEGEQTKTINYQEYYQACRTAAKSFLKVRLNTQTNSADTCLLYIGCQNNVVIENP